MGSEEGSSEEKKPWSVFDRIKTFPSTPESLMAEIDAAITDLESERSTSSLLNCSQPPTVIATAAGGGDSSSSSSSSASLNRYDARVADEAYRAGCAALAAGKLDEALQSLNVSLEKCPPEKASAVAKLQSLICLTSQQLSKPAC